MKKNPKAFFSYTNRFTRTNTDIGPFFNMDGDPVLEPESIVDMLKTQYESVCSIPDKDRKVENPEEFFNSEEISLDNVPFNRDDIINMIDSLSAVAAAGPDGIPAILLKKCKYSLVDGLQILFSKFLLDGQIPSLLKQAFVIPIHKGGSRGIPAYFRPVSLTFYIMKTLERVIISVAI